MNSKSPAFQFYPADFLADENVSLMSLAGRGAYITLMCYCWREGSIPADLRKMAKLCGIDSSAIAELWQELEPCFELANDRYVHHRLEKERAKQEEHKKERSEAGKRGASQRWNNQNKENKEVTKNSLAIAEPMAEPMAKNGSSSSSSSSSSKGGSGAEADEPHPILIALEEIYPGHATNFRTMREMFDLAIKLKATTEQVRAFPVWLAEKHPKKGNSPFAFRDLFFDSLKTGATSAPVIVEAKYNCAKCKDRFVYTHNGQPVKCDCWQKEQAA